MKKEVFEIDQNGYIAEKYAVEFDQEGNPLGELTENFIIAQPPDGLYRAKWNGTEWVEDMAQEEINELNNQPREFTQEDYILDIDFRLSMIELGL